MRRGDCSFRMLPSDRMDVKGEDAVWRFERDGLKYMSDLSRQLAAVLCTFVVTHQAD